MYIHIYEYREDQEFRVTNEKKKKENGEVKLFYCIHIGRMSIFIFLGINSFCSEQFSSLISRRQVLTLNKKN